MFLKSLKMNAATVKARGILMPPRASSALLGKVPPLTVPICKVGGQSKAPWGWHEDAVRAGVYRMLRT